MIIAGRRAGTESPGGALGLVANAIMASKDPSRPNVLFILSDDQGPWAMRWATRT